LSLSITQESVAEFQQRREWHWNSGTKFKLATYSQCHGLPYKHVTYINLVGSTCSITTSNLINMAFYLALRGRSRELITGWPHAKVAGIYLLILHNDLTWHVSVYYSIRETRVATHQLE
jgi:hypothetical protein